MLWKEILAGFAIAGFVSLLPMKVFNALFITDAPAPLRLLENVVLGPIVAVLSFVCSVGNAPLAAVLWAGGISYAVFCLKKKTRSVSMQTAYRAGVLRGSA